MEATFIRRLAVITAQWATEHERKLNAAYGDIEASRAVAASTIGLLEAVSEELRDYDLLVRLELHPREAAGHA